MSDPQREDGVTSTIRKRWDSLVKPPGSLGDLEDWVTRIGDIQGTDQPDVEPASLLLFAGDHGVASEGVSAYPQSVTAAMLETIRDGGAAINTLCEEAGLELEWYNVGVRSELVRNGEKISDGTANILEEPAMTDREVRSAINVGRAALRDQLDEGMKLVGLGEIGIANTTASSALVGAILDCSIDTVVGPGTGVDGEQLRHKQEVVQRALERHDPDPADGREVLRTIGGLELAAQAGVMLEASKEGLPVLLDGFITGAAALAANRIDPDVKNVLLASHSSAEPAHETVLDELGLPPMVNFDLRLGEGSGAALAYPLLKSALAAYRGMFTFADAGLKEPDS